MLRTWAERDDTECPFYLRRDGTDVLLGKNASEHTRLKRGLVGLDYAIDRLPEVPEIEDD